MVNFGLGNLTIGGSKKRAWIDIKRLMTSRGWLQREGCSSAQEPASFDIASIESYMDIPVVTQAEAGEAELLKAGRKGFIYGSVDKVQAF